MREKGGEKGGEGKAGMGEEMIGMMVRLGWVQDFWMGGGRGVSAVQLLCTRTAYIRTHVHGMFPHCT